MIRVLGLLALVFMTVSAGAQSIEWQAHRSGAVVVLGHTFRPNPVTEGRLFVGLNILSRGDRGIHDDESGQGLGGGVDINRVLPVLDGRLMAGGRVDLWSMKVNWRNDTLGFTADSRTLVFQPTARLIYRLRQDPESSLQTIDLTLSGGTARNIATHGQPVGDGAVLLFGVRLAL